MNILGLSAFYHDSSCCLLQNGKLVSAASEERFSRIKHDAQLPTRAFRFCLEQANLLPENLDCIAYYESPFKKTGRQLSFPSPHYFPSNPYIPFREIREKLGFTGRILFFDHHLSHAASAYFYSGFHEAATFTADGVGEWETTSYGIGIQNQLSLFETVDFPHSLGLLYATITAFLGFRVNNGEYKVMGLASYGAPTYLPQLQQLIHIESRGQYKLNLTYFDYQQGGQMFSEDLPALLKLSPRVPETEIKQEHKNLAKSLQVLTEMVLLEKLNYLHDSTNSENLAMAGGIALNAVANRRIRNESAFKRVFFQPVASDAGGCLGAAALAHQKLAGVRSTIEPLSTLFLGPSYSNQQIKRTIAAAGLPANEFFGEKALIEEVATRLAADQIIGWFQGRMEFGPRALGSRSILANPTSPTIQERINKVIKKRESFRPFAPVILWPYQNQHFYLNHHTPFMNEICDVRPAANIPGITHIDGTARPQTIKDSDNPRFAKLLCAFYKKTGIPLLINTSFNQRGEPIVCTPLDAIICLGRSALDAVVLENLLIERQSIPDNWNFLLSDWYANQSMNQDKLENLYTFF